MLRQFRLRDKEAKGVINIGEASSVLRECKILVLTLFQVNLVLGLSSPDFDGNLRYTDFVPLIKHYISHHFCFETLIKK